MGGSKSPHFYVFGIFEPVAKPFGDTRTQTKSMKKNVLEHIICINIGISKLQCRDIVRKGGHWRMMKIRLTKSSKSS